MRHIVITDENQEVFTCIDLKGSDWILRNGHQIFTSNYEPIFRAEDLENGKKKLKFLCFDT